MASVSVSLEYSLFQSCVGLTGKVIVLKNGGTDVIASHLVTKESEICCRKLNLLKVLKLIKRGMANLIMPSRVSSIEKTIAWLMMMVLGT